MKITEVYINLLQEKISDTEGLSVTEFKNRFNDFENKSLTKQNSIISKFFKFISKHDKNIKGASLAIVLIVISYKLYKRYLSKASKLCKDKKNKEKCMIEYRIKANKIRLKDLSKLKGKCSSAVDPIKCTIKMFKKIQRIKATLQGLKTIKKKT